MRGHLCELGLEEVWGERKSGQARRRHLEISPRAQTQDGCIGSGARAVAACVREQIDFSSLGRFEYM